MRNTFAQTLYEIATQDDRIYTVVADISPAGPMAEFSNNYPDRFINVGVAEQTMIGISAGLALKGCRPFAYTIATFSLYRPFEMVRDDLCYQDLPVTVVGMGSGVIYSVLGGTHHTQEDVSIASALPNMQVLAPCDPQEVIEATRWCALESEHPTYLKIGKAGEPTLTDRADGPWVFGKLRFLRRGKDVCLISYGVITKKAIETADALEALGLTVSVVCCHTIKPLDHEGIAKALSDHKAVAVIEENGPTGGLSPRVIEIAWQTSAQCELKCYTLKDEFIHCYGNHDQLLEKHGLSVERFVSELRALFNL